MKKYIFSFIVACLSLTSSLLTFQAAAQDQNTRSANIAPNRFTISTSVEGPRYEIVTAPDLSFVCYKFDKETGTTWKIYDDKVTKIDKELALNDETYPGQNNYQLVVANSSYILLLNVNTGTVWVYLDTLFTKYSRFKELNMGL